MQIISSLFPRRGKKEKKRSVDFTHSGTRAVVVDVREATAVECFLHVFLSVLGFVPSDLQQEVL